MKVAVNGRFVQSPELEQTILSGLRRTVPRDRYPVCLVHLRVPPEQIDWNRTPAKSEVYLHHLASWQQQITQAIEQALRLNATSVPDSLYSSRMGQLLKTAEANGQYHVIPEPDELENAALAADPEVTGLSLIRAIAQVHNRYILAEHPSGVWLIEQHIAHERVLYEQLCDRWQMVPLEPFVLLNQLTSAQVEQLQRLGIDIEPFGEQVWAARSAPAPLATREDCAEALMELSLGGDLQTAQVATACRSAIRNGTPLSLTEMQTLLDQWQRTRNPRTCPHGRPICLTLEESALSRFFRRHWVIGKSHGI
ncbi:DNA mismatch repair endonuclease MutL [Pantanalinema rosaneae CENA516]|uniref:DNA mismatch repair endonuclease MutL n=1 Tax=Pantanalinema rosaneae TaxID=1620701 RepID=UPI003D6E83CF